jgi:hypothetical protein
MKCLVTFFKNSLGRLSFDPGDETTINTDSRTRKSPNQTTTMSYNYNSNVKISHGESMTSVASVAEKKSFWEKFKGFFMVNHNLRRHPFAPPSHPRGFPQASCAVSTK